MLKKGDLVQDVVPYLGYIQSDPAQLLPLGTNIGNAYVPILYNVHFKFYLFYNLYSITKPDNKNVFQTHNNFC